MLNLIKMDLYRLFRIKSFWVMVAVTVFISIFSIYMVHFDVSNQNDTVINMSDMSISEVPPDKADVTFGFYVATEPEWANGIDFIDLINANIAGKILAILCAIFPPVFVNSEEKHGYIKNIAGQLQNRGMLVLSKLVAVAVQVLVVFIVFIISSLVMGKICWGDNLLFTSFGNFARIFGIYYLLHFAFATVVTTITILLRSSGFSMVLGIISSTGITSLIYTFLNIILQKCGVSEEFNIGDYFIENCITTVSPDLSGSELVRVVAVGIVFLAISIITAMTVMQKRDIK